MSNSIDYPNWFLMTAVYHFNNYLKEYVDKPNLKFLQIGAYTGDASKWILDNVLTDISSTLTDVDTWSGSDEEVHKTFDWNSVESTYDKKLSKFNNVIKQKISSKDFLENDNNQYDFIYIDGDHTADAVYFDTIVSWKLLKSNGILAFDDYTWQHTSGDLQKAPGIAIDKFLKEYDGLFNLLEKSNQVWIRKI